MCVCWSHPWVLLKWLNWSKCHLDIDSGGSKKLCIRWRPRSSRGRDNLGGDLLQPVVKYREYMVWGPYYQPYSVCCSSYAVSLSVLHQLVNINEQSNCVIRCNMSDVVFWHLVITKTSENSKMHLKVSGDWRQISKLQNKVRYRLHSFLVHISSFSSAFTRIVPVTIFATISSFLYINTLPHFEHYAFSALTLLVGRQEGHLACKKTEWWGAGMVICLEWGADLHMAQLMPLPLTVSCFSKIHVGFTFMVLAHPGSPSQRAVKQVCTTFCVPISRWWICFDTELLLFGCLKWIDKNITFNECIVYGTMYTVCVWFSRSVQMDGYHQMPVTPVIGFAEDAFLHDQTRGKNY